MNPDYALERLRQKLLDLTLRNRLLNFRKTASSIECIDESPRRVFRRLVDRGRPLGLEPLEEGDSEDPVGAPTPQRSPSSPNPLPANEQPPFPAGSHQSFAPGDSPTGARGPMAEPSESVVPTQPPRRERSRDDPLQTPLDSPTFDRRLRRVLTDAREAIESTGVNLLHLALGFLEWHETDAPDSPVRAPLVLVPVVLERRRVKTGRRENGREIYRYAYRLAYNGEDLSQNISLAAKLRQDFGIDLPTLESDDPETDEPFDVERYFEQVQASVSVHPTGRNWRVQRDVVLGFFSFAKHRMHLDLDPASWPTGRSLLESELARDLLLGRDLQPVTFPSAAEVEEEQARGTLSLVLDADSTQYAALLHALRGHNLVIEGPPGTGKSQTITNLIAAALAQGKTVLFVAEKLAALEVVRHKLDAVDLGSFCLELHSHKAKMSLVLDDLRRRLRLESEDPPYKKDPRRRLNARRETLNAFASLVAQPFAPSRDRVEEILWNAVAASEAEAEARRSSGHEPLPNALPLEFGPSSEWSATRIDDARELLSNVAEHLRDGVHRDAACWRGWSADRLLPNDHELVKVRLESALTLARTLQSSMRDFARRNGLDDSLSLRDIELLHVLEPARLAPPAKLNAAFLEAAYLGDVGAATVEAFFESLESFHESLLKVRDRLPRAETLDAERLEALRDDWQALRERGCAPERRVDFGSVERDLALVSRQLERIALGIETSSRFPELEGASTHRELRIAIDILALLAWRGGLSVDELCAEMAAPLARARFQRAASEGAELEERRRLLESHFSLRDAPEGEALRELRQTLRAARGGIFAWLPWGRAARARRELKTFARDPRATR